MAKQSSYEQAFKAGLIVRGDAEALAPARLPFGIPTLDSAIGGGIPVGRVTLIGGLESTGKTILCQYAAAAQQAQPERREVLYLDMEHSYDRCWWEQSGVDPKRLYVAQPMTGEQMVDVATAAIEHNPQLGMILLDSIAAVSPGASVEAVAAQDYMALRARLMSKFWSKVGVLAAGRITIVATNQLRANMGRPGYTYPGGMQQRFSSHLILRTRRVGWLTEGDQRVGFTMEIEIDKNKTSPPQRPVQIPFRYAGQVDTLAGLIERACEAGLIEKRLPYYRVPNADGEPVSLLGMANLRNHLLEHPSVLARLEERANA